MLTACLIIKFTIWFNLHVDFATKVKPIMRHFVVYTDSLKVDFSVFLSRLSIAFALREVFMHVRGEEEQPGG